MESTLRIHSVEPAMALPGGEIVISCQGFRLHEATDGIFVDGVKCRIVAASSERILAVVPSDIPEASDTARSEVSLVSGGVRSNSAEMLIGRRLIDGMHIVANPAIDPQDGAIIVTRSGSRGQHLPATIFRLEPNGLVDEVSEPVLNPTGVAFNNSGSMFVTNRADGEVYEISANGMATVFATGLGIATGIAFDSLGVMYVGDRSGTIFRVNELGDIDPFTVIEASVAAFHMAFGPDGHLYVTSPGLSSHDCVHVIDPEGFDRKFFRGLGRPQVLAFDRDGNLYVAACFRGRHGIAKISANGASCEHFVAGSNVVGLCFTSKGDMIAATNDSIYQLPCGIKGTLLK